MNDNTVEVTVKKKDKYKKVEKDYEEKITEKGEI